MNLSPTDDARRLNTPPLQGRGRGWGLSASFLAELQTRAKDMRNNPSEPEKRLWRFLSNGQLDGYKFRRQQVIGTHIADFVCAGMGVIVEVDGDTHDDPAADARRDAALAGHGFRVVHVTNGEVMSNIDGVLQMLLATLRSMPSQRAPHPNPSPEGEGLAGSRALGIRLEGSVG